MGHGVRDGYEIKNRDGVRYWDINRDGCGYFFSEY